MTQSSKHVHTIVIGAGISGIKAAVDLHSNAIDTLILEGRDRIGGRLHTFESPLTHRKYDIGASWFHELGFNPLFKKSLALGNVSYVFDDSSAAVIGDIGEIPPNYKLGQVVNEMKLYASKEKDQSTNLHTLSNQYILEHKEVLSKEQIEYAPQLLRTAEIMSGSWDLSNGSKSNLPYGGRDAFVLNHYETVLANELKGYPTEKIKTSTNVTSISKDNVISIKTEAGETFTCDYLIITVPQSVITLPDAIKFSPPLPTHITSNFDKLATTSLAKVVFEFEAPFWNKETEKFIFIGKPDVEFSGKVLKNEISSAEEIPNIEFNKPTETAPKPWDFPFLCVNLQAVKGIPSLLCLIPSPVSIYLERASSTEIWNIFKPLFGKLGDVTDPVNIFSTKWNDDPFSRGAVSAIKPDGVFVNDGFIEGWDNVRFAGEHTIYEGHGCVHGAWLSGKREADYIIKQSK